MLTETLCFFWGRRKGGKKEEEKKNWDYSLAYVIMCFACVSVKATCMSFKKKGEKKIEKNFLYLSFFKVQKLSFYHIFRFPFF